MVSEEQNYLTHPHVEALTARIHSGDVVPLVGAGFSAPFGYPLWERFLRDAAEQFSETKALVSHLLDRKQYERATAVLYEATYDRGMIHQIIDKFARIKHNQEDIRNGLEKAKNSNSDIPAVYILPYIFNGLIATTNVDHVLRDIYQIHLGHRPKIAKNTDDDLDQIHNVVTPVIFKIHGDAEDDMSRIFSRSEYQHHYLTGIGSANIDFTKRIPRSLFNLFKHKSVLFLGCSLYQDRLLDVLRRSRDTSKHTHFAIIEQHNDHNQNNELAERLHDHGVRPVYYPKGKFEVISKILNKIRSDIKSASIASSLNSSAHAAMSNIRLMTIVHKHQLEHGSSTIDLFLIINEHIKGHDKETINSHFPFFENRKLSNIDREFIIKLDVNNKFKLDAYPALIADKSEATHQNGNVKRLWPTNGTHGGTISVEATVCDNLIVVSFINKDTGAKLEIEISISKIS